MERLIVLLVRRRYGGPARSWLIASALVFGWRGVRRVFRPRPLVEQIPIGRGTHLTVDHLPISHKRQIRQLRRARRAARRSASSA